MDLGGAATASSVLERTPMSICTAVAEPPVTPEFSNATDIQLNAPQSLVSVPVNLH